MKIRNLILVATIFALLAVSLNGISQDGDKDSNSSADKKTALIEGTTPPNIPAMSESQSSNAPVQAASSTTEPKPLSGEASTPTSTTTPTPAPTQSSTPSSSTNASSLVQQVQSSGHYKFFSTMVKKGPSVKDPQGEHYGDGCIRCHSAVQRLEDPAAKLDDFFPNGKYANQTEGITCRVCHTMQSDEYSLRQPGWDSCGTCHVSSAGNPIPGVEVRHPQFQMIQGVAIGDILPMPSYKYKYMKDSFSCTSCHVTDKTKHDFMIPGVTVTHDSEGIRRQGTTIDYQQFKAIFKQDSCDVCHPSTTETVNRVQEMQTIIGTKLDELQPIYEEWSEKVKTLDAKDPKVMTFMDGATYYTFVYSDGSKGVHNFPYAKLLLEKAELIWRGLRL